MKASIPLKTDIYFNQHLIIISKISRTSENRGNWKTLKLSPCIMIELIPINKTMFTVIKKGNNL